VGEVVVGEVVVGEVVVGEVVVGEVVDVAVLVVPDVVLPEEVLLVVMSVRVGVLVAVDEDAAVQPEPLGPPEPPSATSRLRPTQLSWRGLSRPLTRTTRSSRPLPSSRLWADATAALPSKRPKAAAATKVLRMSPPFSRSFQPAASGVTTGAATLGRLGPVAEPPSRG
jgi:hypothetical protein